MHGNNETRYNQARKTSHLAWYQNRGKVTVSEAKRLKGLERENTELKKIVAELSLDNRALKAALSKEY